jgi:DNA polymerase-3 subunit gamma/tau
VEAPLALYRRYRPDSFSAVIGQDHVTGPLRAALRNNRVNHAYLFSGPRGCGKTTSARILARALNCAQGPTEEPCGECASCRELATGGQGSIDVIEIDAASHGGVDDARELREQATFRPMRDRYKIYIIDEAHMVSRQGFNALLKIVEEPPEHVRFIFATTEPDKVIGTVRSRTHHYPFRLIPPKVLSAYLTDICGREGVQVDAAALPLVIRAGGGSARDTLSVLDQLIGGASQEGVTYELAAALLGFTPDNLLDEVVDGLAAHDGGAVFEAVDRVVETGQDPARFLDDLLRRLRDLVIVAAVPDASVSGLLDVPQDASERLVAQAARFGRHDLTRAAGVVADGLNDLKGTTAPRILLELVCARLLLPGADDSSGGLAARIDRIEKRMAMGAGSSAPAGAPAAPAPSRPPGSDAPAAASPSQPGTPSQAEPQAKAATQPRTQPGTQPRTQPRTQPPQTGSQPAPPQPERPQPEPPSASRPPEPAAPTPQASTQPQAPVPDPAEAEGAPRLTLVDIRRLWPELLTKVGQRRRMAWILLSQHAQAIGLDGRRLTLGFNNPGARESFVAGKNDEILRQCLIDLIGDDLMVDAVIDQSAQPGTGTPPPVGRPAAPTSPGQPPPPPGPQHGSAESSSAQPSPGGSPAGARPDPGPSSGGAGAGRAQAPPHEPRAGHDGASRDDRDADHLDTEQLLAHRLGAQLIEEIPRD